MQATRVTVVSAMLLTAGLSVASSAPAVTWSRTAAAAHPVTRATSAGTRDRNPAANITATPDFTDACWRDGSPSAQQSDECRSAALAAINNAHTVEGIRPIRLPGNFWSLRVNRQLFVIANLERVSRGFPPVRGLTRQINGWAAAGAQRNEDPSARGWRLSSGARIRAWGANWAADYNALTADYSWMYLDGWAGTLAATSNLACTSPTAAGCWGHRDNILARYDGSHSLAAGTGATARGWDGYFNSYTQLFVQYTGHRPRFLYTWRDATRAGAR
jgi:hypothetical protein